MLESAFVQLYMDEARDEGRDEGRMEGTILMPCRL